MERYPKPKKEIITKELISHALSEIQRKYGTGNGDGETPKKYHNLGHTQEVLSDATRIAQLSAKVGKISADDIFIIQIAAAFHDVEQNLGGGKNEVESAGIAEGQMRKTGVFKEDEIQKARRLIVATTVFFKDGAMMQSASDEYSTQIIADADLAYLGKENPGVYWEKAANLLREIKRTDTPSREDLLAFANGQPAFLEHHHFYTEEANTLFPHKQENIQFIQKHAGVL
jgi:predicted metal-dependent HD superfamily phosphohydrolase